MRPTKFIKTCVPFLFMCLCSMVFLGQKVTSQDLHQYSDRIEASQFAMLDSLPQDSTRTSFLLDFGYTLEGLCPDTAILIYSEAAQLARELERPEEEGKAYMYTGIVYSDLGQFEESMAYYDTAQTIFTEANSLLNLANLHVNLGVVYNFQSKWNDAAEHYFEAIEYYDSLGSYYHISIACGNVGGVLMDANQPENALPYFERGYEASLQTLDSTTISSSLINIGFAQQVLGELEASRDSYFKALEIANAINDTEDLYLSNHNLSDVYSKMDKLDTALSHGYLAYAYAKEIDRLYYKGNAAMNLGSRLVEVEQHEEAIPYLEEGLLLGQQMESNELMADCHGLLAKAAKAQGAFEKALEHWEKYTEISQATFSQKNVDRMQQLEVEYQTVQKDKELLANKLELEQKDSRIKREQFVRNASLGAGILLAIIFALFVFNFMQRKRLHSQEIDSIKKEQMITSIQSYMDGEEQERLRMAKDLHDGLSGLLAATKLQFSAVQPKVADSEAENMRQAMSSLDNASKEVRRIAHNMMPEMLISYGLVEALKSFFAGINASGQLNVDFQHYGIDQRLPENIELSVYRIVQELINNVIKHAKANEAIVQINQHEQLLAITVEDDGAGFDVEEAMRTGGIGLKNLQSRADLLHSELTIESEPGKGTFTYFEVDLANQSATA